MHAQPKHESCAKAVGLKIETSSQSLACGIVHESIKFWERMLNLDFNRSNMDAWRSVESTC